MLWYFAINLLMLAVVIWLWWRLCRRRVNRRYIKRNGIDVETGDPLAAEIISRAFLSGRPVYGERRADGSVRINEEERP